MLILCFCIVKGLQIFIVLCNLLLYFLWHQTGLISSLSPSVFAAYLYITVEVKWQYLNEWSEGLRQSKHSCKRCLFKFQYKKCGQMRTEIFAGCCHLFRVLFIHYGLKTGGAALSLKQLQLGMWSTGALMCSPRHLEHTSCNKSKYSKVIK